MARSVHQGPSMKTLALTLWLLLCGSVAVTQAAQEDVTVEPADGHSVVFLPDTCSISSEGGLDLHVVLCDADLTCTQALLESACSR